MLIDEARTRKLLCQIIRRLTPDAALRDDLSQEALVHLWLLEERRPGQSRSWYLQSCKYHLRNYLSAGKSVDSLKRRRGGMSFPGDTAEIDDFVSEVELSVPVIAQISARDIITQLSGRLSTFERSVLCYLAEGLRAREIAARLKVSHPTVIKHRRKIAALAVKMGIPPLPKYERIHRLPAARETVARSMARF